MKKKNIHRNLLLFFVAALFSFLLSPENASSAAVESVISGHNTCEQCHGRFPGRDFSKKNDSNRSRPTKIPTQKIDQLCLGCHGPAGISSLKAAVHAKENYAIKKTIGCVTCHDPHDNNPNYLDGKNIKLIGENKWSRQNNYAKIRTTSRRDKKRFVVFESRGTDAGEPSLHSFADGDEDSNGVFDGVCEVCHTKTKYHRNDGTGDRSHYTGQTCTSCHAHVNQFLAFSDDPDEPISITGTVRNAGGNAMANITLFLDINGNGVYDEGEPTAITDSSGNYIFEGQADKGYAVLVMPSSIPFGYEVTISVSGNEVNITFTPKPVAVNGYVWSDTNLNGKFDKEDQGLPDILIFADKNVNGLYDVGEPVTSTNSLGFYVLTGFPGSYVIQIDETTIPEEYVLITDNVPYSRFLGPGMVLSDINFGYKNLLQVPPTNTALKYPTRLAWKADGGYLAADYYADAVFIYDAAGNLTGQIKSLDKPLALATDSAGRIYVGNVGRRNIEIYNAAGVLQSVLAQGEIEMPNDMALDHDGRLYVADSRNKHIRVFNPDGTDALTIGQPDPNGSLFDFPNTLAIHYRMENGFEIGELYVGDSSDATVKVFDLQGNIQRAFGGSAYSEGYFRITLYWEGLFADLQSLEFDQNGMLHVLDSYMDRVQIINPVTGEYSNEYYDTFTTGQDPELPMDIAISATGKVIVSSAKLATVQLIHTAQ